MGVAGTLTSSANALLAYSRVSPYPYLIGLSKTVIVSLFQKIEAGQLKITDVDGTITICGQHQVASSKIDKGQETVYDVPQLELVVHKDIFWLRMLIYADMGFAESYMLGEFSCSNLTSFFKLFILNRAALANATTTFSWLSTKLSTLVRKTNTLSNARLNIAAHYDISNAMFEAFLSPDMTYSCPVFLPRSDPAHLTESLEQAQMRKLQRFVDNARIQESDHVLEIGTGWGSFAIHAVRQTGCRVTSLTLSKEQKALAEERIAEAGFVDKIEVLLCDYRALPLPKGGKRYDKVVSIEMLEAVGKEYLATYFECIDKLLDKDHGIAVFQCITMPESRYDVYTNTDDFIRRYIFPGGHLPSITGLLDSCALGAKDTLIPETIENIGPHYAKTLRLWRESFLANFDSRIKPALLDEYQGVDGGKAWTEADIQLFRRKWEYYFCYCEAGFATKTLGDVIVTFGREGAVNMMDDVPL